MTENYKLVAWLKDIRKKDISTVGGKAANLGEMFAKFPIPDGFVITVSAFQNFLESNKILDRINQLSEGIDFDNLKSTQAISKKIEKIILNSKIPKKLEFDILKNYKKINGFVAVRSSAVAEDLEEASFAGQQATLLNVDGNWHLLKSVKECWASFYTSRAILYRKKNNFSQEPRMAVVVQKMIDAKKSGVIFTANPVTKNRNEMVIESIFGLGEAIVSGIVTPDNFIIDKDNKKIISETINEKNIMIIRQSGKNKTIKLDSKNANKKTLNEKELNGLIDVSLNIEKYYKKPMDIEWAIDDKIYILQARPITTL